MRGAMGVNYDLMRQWLYMQAMNYAVTAVKSSVKRWMYPKEKYEEWKHTGWINIQRECLEYALAHWKTQSWHGSFSGHNRFEIGLDVQMGPPGVTAKYRDMEVTIPMAQVKSFIREMLAWQPEYKQITMFELLADEASK